MTKQAVALVTATAIATYITIVFGVGGILNIHRNTDYNVIRLSLIINPIVGLLTDRAGYNTQDAMLDQEVFGKLWDLEKLKATYWPLSCVPALYHVPRKVDLAGPEFREVQRRFLRLAFANPHVIAAERVKMFAATLGPNSYRFENLIWTGPVATHGIVHAGFLGKLSEIQEAFARNFVVGDKTIASVYGFPFTFSALIPLGILVAFLMTWRIAPAVAYASLFIAITLLALLVTNISNDFRYVYYLFLYPIFAIPAFWCELRHRNFVRVREATVHRE